MSLQVTITANGREFTVPAGTTLDAFLRGRGFAPESVLVELNGRALPPAEVARTRMQNGDGLKIRTVAGE